MLFTCLVDVSQSLSNCKYSGARLINHGVTRTMYVVFCCVYLLVIKLDDADKKDK